MLFGQIIYRLFKNVIWLTENYDKNQKLEISWFRFGDW